MTMTTSGNGRQQREIDEAVQKAIEPEIHQPRNKPAVADAAPTEVAVAQEHAHMLLTSVTNSGLGNLRELRDHLDELIKDISGQRDLITEALLGLAGLIDSVNASKDIMDEGITKLRAEFNRSRTPLPPAPQLNGRRGR
jgi:hypothetical protein